MQDVHATPEAVSRSSSFIAVLHILTGPSSPASPQMAIRLEESGNTGGGERQLGSLGEAGSAGSHLGAGAGGLGRGKGDTSAGGLGDDAASSVGLRNEASRRVIGRFRDARVRTVVKRCRTDGGNDSVPFVSYPSP